MSNSLDLQIRRLRLRNFRSHAEAIWEFGPDNNWFAGPNGSGKTNALEAIYMLVTGRSFRTRRLAECVRVGATYFSVEAEVDRGGVRQGLALVSDGQSKRIQLNGTTLSSAGELMGVLPGTLLGPHDQELVKGAPAARRGYLDVQLAQVDADYLDQLMRYQRALKQRNALLRAQTLRTIETWEEQMAVAGAKLILRRRRLVADLQPRIEALHGELAPGKPLQLKYHSLHAEGSELVSQFQQQLATARLGDLKRCVTSIGPHRDDCTFWLSEQGARQFASEGEQRSCATALRLAEWEQLVESSGCKALRLIDDVGVSIDGRRRHLLAGVLDRSGQRFLSAPEPCWPLGERDRIVQLAL